MAAPKICVITIVLAFVAGTSAAVATRPALTSRLRGGAGVPSTLAKRQTAAPSPKSGKAAAALTKPAGPPLAGVLTVLGGLLLHMTLGTMYCWGSFIGYLPPSMRFFDGAAADGRQPDALLVIPLLIMSQMLAMPLGAKLNKMVGPRNAMLIGSLVMNAGILSASRATTLLPFILGYSLLFGLGVGLGYTAPMQAGWGWFPKSKGLVNGIVLLGFGFGGFLFTLLGQRVANPTGLKLSGGTFPAEVYAAFPKMLRTLALCYLAMSALGALLVTPAPVPKAATGRGKARRVVMSIDRTFGEALHSPMLWLLWAMILMAAPAGLATAAVFKTFALSSPHLADDGFLSMTGGLATLCNGLGRVGWATLSDILGFRPTFALLGLVQTLACLVYPTPAVQASRPLFLALTCALLACMGGNFAMFPTACANTFGSKDGAAIYSVLFTAFGTASLAAVSLSKRLERLIGWQGVYAVFAALSVAAIAASRLYKPLPPRAMRS